jgi:hypothetical protein
MSRLRLGLLLCAWAIQQPIPPYQGPDVNDPHNGQPAWCQAHDTEGYKKNCGICDAPCYHQGAEDTRCKTSCRHGKCKCHPECHT